MMVKINLPLSKNQMLALENELGETLTPAKADAWCTRALREAVNKLPVPTSADNPLASEVVVDAIDIDDDDWNRA